MQKKMNLSNLRLHSFVTKSQEEVKGGGCHLILTAGGGPMCFDIDCTQLLVVCPG